jgi:ATP synthase protein I
MASPPPEPRNRPSKGVGQMALAMELPFIMIASVVVGGGIGYFLDKQFHTGPALALILGVVGFASGIWDILRRLSRNEKSQNDGGG